jgi:uncharacterized membrane protein
MTLFSNRWRLLTGIVISTHFLLILLLGLSRHWSYMSSLNDLGVFDQAAWGTLNGEFLLNTSNPFSQPINWLGFHFNLILLAFVPLYAIAPVPEWFTLAQSLALSLAAWPIFLLASRVCQSEKVGLLWALVYLVNPFQLNAAAWDFHPITLAVPFIALGFLAIERADSRMLIWSCIPLLLIQEHLGLTVAGFGLLWRLHNGNWRPAAIFIMLGLIHSFLVIGFVMPEFSPTGNHLMLQSGTGQLSRYSWLGNSVPEVLQTLTTHPFSVIKIVLLNWGGGIYLAMLLLPLLGLPLAATSFLLPGAADLALNLLSANPMPRGVFAYHSVALAAVFTVAAIYGSRWFSHWVKRYSLTELASLALLSCFVVGYVLAPLPLPMALNVWQPISFAHWPDSAPERIRTTIGNSASVSAQANIGPHFSQRREIFVYPGKVGKVDVIILKLESPTTRLAPSDKASLATLAHHLQMNQGDYLDSIGCLLSGKGYGVLLWDDPWLVMSRNIKSEASQLQEIRLKIQQLQKLWLVGKREVSTGQCSSLSGAG